LGNKFHHAFPHENCAGYVICKLNLAVLVLLVAICKLRLAVCKKSFEKAACKNVDETYHMMAMAEVTK
jgi:hypothetical protein